jgi:hypothetical protein
VAMVNFLSWLAASPGETELSAARKLLEFRTAGANFKGESFPAISGAGEDGAIIHYRVTPETNRPIKPNEVYLIDSGGQYLDGTTDITRTLWTGPDATPAEIKANVTRAPFSRKVWQAGIWTPSRARNYGAPGWITTTVPAMASAPTSRCMKARPVFPALPGPCRSPRA